jgi:two-component system, chemotaxis family, response regulator Rcp1
MPGTTTLHILVIDDNPGDVDLVKAACEACGLCGDFNTAATAEEAIEFLRHLGGQELDLVVLDLNLRLSSGIDVLKFISSQRDYRGIPVLVLTGVDRPHDRQLCLDLGAVEYAVKPTFFDEEYHLIERLKPLILKER